MLEKLFSDSDFWQKNQCANEKKSLKQQIWPNCHMCDEKDIKYKIGLSELAGYV